ncbi:MAG: AsmA family protein, partial [Pseudomonadales bacterium]|nr:AsmA family protein [Pseudomonadales bacterium]
MPAILRFLVVVLLGLALLLGAVAAFVLTLDAERWRGTIREQVRARVGLDLKLDGPLRFRVWPAIALEVEDVAADWTDADADPLLEVRRAELRAALLPLLSTSPRLEVESVLLDGVALDLRVDEVGRDNWSAPEDATAPPAEAPDAAPASDAAFALAELAVTDLSLRYADARDGTRARLEAVDAVVTDVGGSGPAEARVTGRFAVEDGPGGTLTATLRAVPARGRYDLLALRTELVLPEATTPVVLEAEGALELPPDGDALRIPGLTLRSGALAATLEGRVDALASDAPALDLHLAVPDGDPRPLLEALGVALAFADPGALARVGGELTVTGTPDALEVSPLTLRVDTLRLQGRAGVRTGGARPRVDFELEAGETDLRPYLATTDEEASAEGGPLLPDDPLGLEVLESFDARGRLRADAVVLE